ncbi:multidrug efflux SMR transporter [Paenibacillus antri]|uniref:Multidrug efflux SMR transporter n=1 Tax=Paenibacillus antri TaxID=2582848 RepID=A0A5R9GEV2_9BACL|nr:multidrug efflux SMR transporter [Paenibacillus antri]TLS53679.1 multidrug efflux SMR transporter [Paenibacillus antri]
MAWVSLFIAGLFEIVGVIGMNRIKRDNNVLAYLLFGIGIAMSFLCLSFAMRSLPMGTSYAIWTGIGTAGGALAGMLFYNESKDKRRIACIGMVLFAAVGLKLIS